VTFPMDSLLLKAIKILVSHGKITLII
jgi:hypothetical protein